MLDIFRKFDLLKKFIIFTFLVILTVTILFSLVITSFMKYFEKEKFSLLDHTTNMIEKYINSNIFENNKDYYNSLSEYCNILSYSTNSDLYLINEVGDVIVSTNKEKFDISSKFLNSELLYNFNGSVIKQKGNLYNIYKEIYYVFGRKLYNQDKVTGYIFMSMPSIPLNNFLKNNFKILLVLDIVILSVCVLLLYLLFKNTVKPLKKIANAIKDLEKGNFDVRINDLKGDKEIVKLANSFNNMAASLFNFENTRRTFIANVSHELRTPMTSISGFIDGILDGTISYSDEKKYLNIVSKEINRLSRVVNSMLNLARVEEGAMNLNKTNFDIIQVIKSIIFSFEYKINEKNINIGGIFDYQIHYKDTRITCIDDEKIFVNADFDLIYQVVYNLVENAVKFTNNYGYINFNFKIKQDKIFIIIENSGDGIEERELKEIFEKFYKIDKSRAIDRKGIGLGLYLARYIINLHQEDIFVESSIGKYTRFTFSLKKCKKLKNK